MSFAKNPSPRRSSGAKRGAFADRDAPDVANDDGYFEASRVMLTHPSSAAKRSGSPLATSPVASPSRKNIGGWLRSRLGGDVGGGDVGATGTAGVRFDAPPTPASTVATLGHLGDVLQADNEALFRHGLFNAVGNALLLLLVGLLFAVNSLLAQWRSPILWALLTSLALRDVKTSLVRFFAHQLERHTLVGLALAPLNAVIALCASTVRRVETLVGLRPRTRTNPSAGRDRRGRRDGSRRSRASGTAGAAVPLGTLGRTPGRIPGTIPPGRIPGTIPPEPDDADKTTSASTFHFRWLFVAGVIVELWSLASRDWALTRAFAALAALAAFATVATAALVAVAHWYVFAREGAHAAALAPVGVDDGSGFGTTVQVARDEREREREWESTRESVATIATIAWIASIASIAFLLERASRVRVVVVRFSFADIVEGTSPRTPRRVAPSWGACTRSSPPV